MFQDIQKNKIKTGAIISLFIIMITLIIYYVCTAFDFGYISIVFALIFSIGSATLSYYNCDKIVLKINHARPATEEEFKKLGVDVYVTTVNGEYGIKGFVTDALKNLDYTYFYTCGPEPMLKAVYNATKTSGQFSFEERMGCGFGACMGCSCKTKYGNKRICKDGPVLIKEEIIW